VLLLLLLMMMMERHGDSLAAAAALVLTSVLECSQCSPVTQKAYLCLYLCVIVVQLPAAPGTIIRPASRSCDAAERRRNKHDITCYVVGKQPL
jgi:hypothetical protein